MQSLKLVADGVTLVSMKDEFNRVAGNIISKVSLYVVLS